MGRAAQGVRLINLKEEDRIASVARVTFENSNEIEENENGEEISPDNEENSENES